MAASPHKNILVLKWFGDSNGFRERETLMKTMFRACVLAVVAAACPHHPRADGVKFAYNLPGEEG
jgi:hypothetical protein